MKSVGLDHLGRKEVTESCMGLQFGWYSWNIVSCGQELHGVADKQGLVTAVDN